MEGSSLVSDAWHLKQLYAAFIARFISEGIGRNRRAEGEAGASVGGGSKWRRGDEKVERALRQG